MLSPIQGFQVASLANLPSIADQTILGNVSGASASPSALTATQVATFLAGRTFEAGNGAVGTPSFTFDGDEDTGLYRVGANSIGFAVAGSLRMTIAAAITTAVDLIVGEAGGGALDIYGRDINLYNSGSNKVYLGGAGVLSVCSTGYFAIGSGATSPFSQDTSLYRTAAGVMAVGTGGGSGTGYIFAKLKADNAYVAGVQAPTGYIVIYDNTGTAYKVSVNV